MIKSSANIREHVNLSSARSRLGQEEFLVAGYDFWCGALLFPVNVPSLYNLQLV